MGIHCPCGNQVDFVVGVTSPLHSLTAIYEGAIVSHKECQSTRHTSTAEFWYGHAKPGTPGCCSTTQPTPYFAPKLRKSAAWKWRQSLSALTCRYHSSASGGNIDTAPLSLRASASMLRCAMALKPCASSPAINICLGSNG